MNMSRNSEVKRCAFHVQPDSTSPLEPGGVSETIRKQIEKTVETWRPFLGPTLDLNPFWVHIDSRNEPTVPRTTSRVDRPREITVRERQMPRDIRHELSHWLLDEMFDTPFRSLERTFPWNGGLRWPIDHLLATIEGTPQSEKSDPKGTEAKTAPFFRALMGDPRFDSVDAASSMRERLLVLMGSAAVASESAANRSAAIEPAPEKAGPFVLPDYAPDSAQRPTQQLSEAAAALAALDGCEVDHGLTVMSALGCITHRLQGRLALLGSAALRQARRPPASSLLDLADDPNVPRLGQFSRAVREQVGAAGKHQSRHVWAMLAARLSENDRPSVHTQSGTNLDRPPPEQPTILYFAERPTPAELKQACEFARQHAVRVICLPEPWTDGDFLSVPSGAPYDPRFHFQTYRRGDQSFVLPTDLGKEQIERVDWDIRRYSESIRPEPPASTPHPALDPWTIMLSVCAFHPFERVVPYAPEKAKSTREVLDKWAENIIGLVPG